MLRNTHKGNWIINLPVLLCNLNIIISQSCDTNKDRDYVLPENWPCEWNSGKIPFAYNFYSLSKNRRRLISLVKTAHTYLEERSCITFEENDPMKLVKKNITYLYYVFSGALENCCLKFYKKPRGRRMVLVTPICRMPGEIAHATLHGMGLVHSKNELFNEFHVRSILFATYCKGRFDKIKAFVNE